MGKVIFPKSNSNWTPFSKKSQLYDKNAKLINRRKYQINVSLIDKIKDSHNYNFALSLL